MAEQSKPSKAVRPQDTGEYHQRRVQILAEINADKISIDRECFIKTKEEKAKLKELKKLYKLNN
jgi:hypothetical protein